jgi:hypothetical protein
LYDSITTKALARFDESTTQVGVVLSEAGKRCVADVLNLAKTANSAGDFAASVVTTLDKSQRGPITSLHTAATKLRVTLETLMSVIGREHLTTIDVASVTMAAAQPALEATLEIFAKTLKTTFRSLVLTVAIGLSRFRAAGGNAKGGLAAEAAKSAIYALQHFIAAQCNDFVKGVTAIGRECLKTRHVDHTKQFASLMGQAVVEVLEEVHNTLMTAADPLQAHAFVAASPLAAAVPDVPKGGAALGAVCLCFSAVARAIFQSAIPTVASDADLPGDAVSIIKNKFEDAHRKLVNASIPLLSNDIGGTALLFAITSSADSDVKAQAPPQGVSAQAKTVAQNIAAAGELVECFMWEDKIAHRNQGSTVGANNSSVVAPARHARHSSTGGSAYSRGSGDSGTTPGVRPTGSSAQSAAQRSNSAYGGAGGSARGGPPGAGSQTGAVSGMRAPQHLRRDTNAHFTSDVDRLFARPTGQSVALRPTTLDLPHIMEALLSHVLLDLTAALRGSSYKDANGFQQLQVDVAFLMGVVNAHASTWVRKLDRILALCDELVTSAYERTAQRVALPADAVMKLVQQQLSL